jgi:hypothetical protein
MSVEEFREAFRSSVHVEKDWSLARESFRKQITVDYTNTQAVFEFSGVIDEAATNVVALSSSLVSFQIIHPVKSSPDTAFRSPPRSIHYQYLKRLHDAYRAGLGTMGVKYQHEEMFHSGYGYLFWERIVSAKDGVITFTYWSNTSQEGISANAPAGLVAEDLRKERRAAAVKTWDWPIPICGNR